MRNQGLDYWICRLQNFNYRMNVLDWNLKQLGYFIGAIATALAVFGQSIAFSATSASLEKRADKVFKGKHPEYVLAQLDGYSDWGTVGYYTDLLNSMSNDCGESRDSVAYMAFDIAKRHKDLGYQTTYYGVLESFSVSAQDNASYENGRTSCYRLYDYWKKGLK
jgi:hypothetical protein